jgi:hypothetical protein
MAFMLGITPWPVASALLRIIRVVPALYLARPAAHRAIRAMARAFHRGFKTASGAVSRSGEKLAARNRDVLLDAGREARERAIEREFDRANATFLTDLDTPGTCREFDLQPCGFEVIAMDVTRLRSDNIDPRENLARLQDWRGRVETEGGHRGVNNTLDGLHAAL